MNNQENVVTCETFTSEEHDLAWTNDFIMVLEDDATVDSAMATLLATLDSKAILGTPNTDAGLHFDRKDHDDEQVGFLGDIMGAPLTDTARIQAERSAQAGGLGLADRYLDAIETVTSRDLQALALS